jgi:hypothetical protein
VGFQRVSNNLHCIKAKPDTFYTLCTTGKTCRYNVDFMSHLSINAVMIALKCVVYVVLLTLCRPPGTTMQVQRFIGIRSCRLLEEMAAA